ncbi:FMN-binding negative transcriptional regulator [Streptomyces corynorhini]|uniref:FMN-binding negative transcriptional regulator n=1 Tax=Streptomyces corynorhini TaxID=2282652 RepID=A0A370BHL7_9ACTN|nr:FMN-binding negative transcriptional regulator [Streptomyces corynorhini]RDG39819.1 FMN-binding negative transcriptional regulator [Streptomyces corynorhini]
MYVPAHYRGSPEAALAVVRAGPLATLVTGADPVPFATHLPVIVPPEVEQALRDGPADLRGHRLIGHMNRANPHWRHIASGEHPSLLIFRGPDGYISPEIYGYTPAAPTWNFTAVHVRGTLRPLPAGEETLRVIHRTVRALEGRFGRRWDMRESLDYFDKIVPAVGAFELDVEEVDGMFKLSQELNEETREKTTQHFATSEHGTHRDLANEMERVNAARCPMSEREK